MKCTTEDVAIEDVDAGGRSNLILFKYDSLWENQRKRILPFS